MLERLQQRLVIEEAGVEQRQGVRQRRALLAVGLGQLGHDELFNQSVGSFSCKTRWWKL